MKIQIMCEKCGSYIELKSTQKGNQVQLSSMKINKFTSDIPFIEVICDLEEITDIDEVVAELKEIKITCSKCGDYILLEP